MKTKTTESERRNFFKKAAASVMSAGVISIVPFNLFSRSKNETKNPQQQVSISINPMAVKRKQK